MGKFMIVFMLFVSWASFAQNDYIMMSRIRPLIDVEINGHKAAMLIDTGSELTLISKSMISVIGADKHITKKSAFGAGGQISIWELSRCSLKVKGMPVSNIMATDLDMICESIENTTGIRAIGILGVPAIRELGMIIDLKRGIITLKD